MFKKPLTHPRPNWRRASDTKWAYCPFLSYFIKKSYFCVHIMQKLKIYRALSYWDFDSVQKLYFVTATSIRKRLTKVPFPLQVLSRANYCEGAFIQSFWITIMFGWLNFRNFIWITFCDLIHHILLYFCKSII